MERIFGVILAGGSGARMQQALPKQFLSVGGKPILVHTAAVFAACRALSGLIIVTPKAWIRHTEEVLQDALPKGSFTVIEGGENRSESLMQAVRTALTDDDTEKGPLLITHDAVRPFIDQRILEDNIRAAKETGSAMTVIPATDTIVMSEDGSHVSAVPDRRLMFQMQTPQSFYARDFEAIFSTLTPVEKEALTDASKVLLYGGRNISMVEGSRNNIKITFPEDLARAEEIACCELQGKRV